MFGGQPTAGGKTIVAHVEESDESPDWFEIVLEVTTVEGAPPLEGDVTFYLHDTFVSPVRVVDVKGGRAVLTVSAYGAFTVGAVTADGVELELDLASLPDAPKRFAER